MMTYPYPIPQALGAYSSQVYLYPGANPGGGNLGNVVKPDTATVFINVDYSALSPAVNILNWSFLVTPGSSPAILITGSNIGSKANVLGFYLSGGVPGLTYNVTINVTLSNGTGRADTFELSIPENDNCGCSSGLSLPVGITSPLFPAAGSQQEALLNQTYFVIDKEQFFISTSAPSGANIGDQWFNPSNNILSEYVSTGTEFFWSPINVESVLFAEQLTVIGSNTVSNLTQVPNGFVELIINKSATFINVGANPAFSVASGGVITWLSTIYSILPGSEVVAVYTVDQAVAVTPTNLYSAVSLGQQVIEQLTVLGPNSVSNLTFTPASATNVELVVNGQTFLPVGTQPPFNVVGKVINWTSTLYTINAGDEVKAIYNT